MSLRSVDITIDTDGSGRRKDWFDLLDNKQSMDLTVKIIKDNREL